MNNFFSDEQGNEESVTFAEMFEEVKLYAAAFRKNGLKKGDTVACKHFANFCFFLFLFTFKNILFILHYYHVTISLLSFSLLIN